MLDFVPGDKPLKIEGHHSDPFVVDWDGHGESKARRSLKGEQGNGTAEVHAGGIK
jgi:hypothetical protein